MPVTAAVANALPVRLTRFVQHHVRDNKAGKIVSFAAGAFALLIVFANIVLIHAAFGGAAFFRPSLLALLLMAASFSYPARSSDRARNAATQISTAFRTYLLRLQTILLHDSHKGAEIDGFMDHSIRFDIVHKPAASYDHYRDRAHPSVPLLLREKFPATHYRHHQIEDDEGGCHTAQAIECLAAVLSAYNRVAFVREQLCKSLAALGLVINH